MDNIMRVTSLKAKVETLKLNLIIYRKGDLLIDCIVLVIANPVAFYSV